MSEINVISREVKTIDPYFNVKFDCSMRRFRQIRCDICDAGVAAGIDSPNRLFTEKCDYKGDLQELHIHEDLRELVVGMYNIEGAEDYQIRLSCVC